MTQSEKRFIYDLSDYEDDMEMHIILNNDGMIADLYDKEGVVDSAWFTVDDLLNLIKPQ